MDRISSHYVKQALSGVKHPEINYNLVDLGMIKGIICKDNKVSIILLLPVLHVPIKDILIRSIEEAVNELDSVVHVEISEEEMSQEELTRFTKMAKEGWKF